MTPREIAFENEILRGVVGSTAHGTELKGQDDRDEMAVFVEPAVNVCGLRSVDHYIYRDQPEGVRSQPGDLDLTMYSLRKFCRLAAQGNPSVLVLLWLPEYITQTRIGAMLVDIREAFISREAGQRFLGYLVSQRLKLTGEKSQQTKRPELIARYGYDTKFAMHALRLGYEGIELLTEGTLTLPVPKDRRQTLMAVRRGEISFSDALGLIDSAERRLRTVADAYTKEADLSAINEFMVKAHRVHWEGRER